MATKLGPANGIIPGAVKRQNDRQIVLRAADTNQASGHLRVVATRRVNQYPQNRRTGDPGPTPSSGVSLALRKRPILQWTGRVPLFARSCVAKAYCINDSIGYTFLHAETAISALQSQAGGLTELHRDRADRRAIAGDNRSGRIVGDPYRGRTRAHSPSGALVPTHRSGERLVLPGELPA